MNKKWKYIGRIKNGLAVFDVIPPFKIKIPETLFKFYNLNENSIDALTEEYVYASRPHQLNDIFDCDPRLIEVIDEGLYTNLLGRNLEKRIEKKEDKEYYFQWTIEKILFERIGILSTTSSPNNYLMWAYYSNHKGFVIEYDYKNFGFHYHGPFPINYQKDIAKFKTGIKNIPRAILYLSNIKTEHWKHEDEWRILIEPPKDYIFDGDSKSEIGSDRIHDQKFPYDKKAIRSLYLGVNFFDLKRELISQNKNCLTFKLDSNKLYKASILNYLADNNINTYLAQKKTKTLEIEFISSKVKKEGNYKFTFTSKLGEGTH